MSFTLLACSDIRAQKVNLEFPFAAPPGSVEELTEVIQEAFRAEEVEIKKTMGVSDNRPCEPFHINRLQKYSDDTQSWSPVQSIAVLRPYDQLYVFRKNSTAADISPQRELPPPRRSKFYEDLLRNRREPTGMAGSGRDGDMMMNGRSAFNDPTHYQNNTPRHGASSSSHHHPQPNSGPSPYANNNNAYNSYSNSIPTTGKQYGSRSSQSYMPSANRRSSASPYRFPSNHYDLHNGNVSSLGLDVPPPPQTAANNNNTNNNGLMVVYKERTTSERVEYLFRLGDRDSRMFLTAAEFEGIFRAAAIRFPAAVVEDLFRHFARDNGRLTFDDFGRYAADFPVAVNIAYQRLTNQERENALVTSQRDQARRMEELQRHVQELQERLAAAQREVQLHEAQGRQVQEDMRDLRQRQDPVFCAGEQELLDKEVSVFKYRERLTREEQDYERLAMERRRRTMQQSSMGMDGATPYRTSNRYGPDTA